MLGTKSRTGFQPGFGYALMTFEIERGGGAPVWSQIAGQLAGRIRSGELKPGQKLPTEADLARLAGVNRHTVRQALAALSEEGLVRAEQGRGSFVREHVRDYAVGPRTRFSESLSGPEAERSRRLLSAEKTPADAAAAEALGLRRGARLWRIRTLTLVDGRPFSLTTHVFHAARLPEIADHFVSTLSISKALALSGVGDYRRAVTRIQAVLPGGAEAELLEMPANRPLLRTESVNVDADGRPVEYGVALFAADRVQFVVGEDPAPRGA